MEEVRKAVFFIIHLSVGIALCGEENDHIRVIFVCLISDLTTRTGMRYVLF